MRPTFQEFKQDMKQMRIRKPADNIPLELIKHGGLPLQAHIFTLIWESQQVLKELKDVAIMIFKKGNEKDWENYRGISLFSIMGNVFAMILLNQLQIIAEKILSESQYRSLPLRAHSI